MEFKPRDYQLLAEQHILANPRCGIWMEMGLGKTAACIDVITTLQLIKSFKTLVISTRRVARDVWPDEINKWDNFRHLRVSVLVDLSTKRRQIALHAKADIYTINFEQVPWLCKEFTGRPWPFSIIVVDEATKLKNFNLKNMKKSIKLRSQQFIAGVENPEAKPVKSGSATLSRAKVLAERAFDSKYFIELTGTPRSNKLEQIWGQLWFLDAGMRLGRTKTSFLNRWFRKVHPMSYNYEPTEVAEKEITDRIKDICISIRTEDYFKVEKPIFVDLPVTLPEESMKRYKEMEKELFTKIRDQEIEVFNAANKSQKCLQIANGTVYYSIDGTATPQWIKAHDAKMEALDDLLSELNGKPLIIVYQFRCDFERISYAYGFQALDSKKNEEDWNSGKLPAICIHPKSGGHGLNLQYGGHHMVFFGHWWDHEEYRQCIERIGPVRQKSAGFNRSVYVYHIRAVDTIDNLVIESHNTNKSAHDTLMGAVKGRLCIDTRR